MKPPLPPELLATLPPLLHALAPATPAEPPFRFTPVQPWGTPLGPLRPQPGPLEVDPEAWDEED
ncbi:MAG: hypothetical protein H6740_08500 [Alphaproteobacteria bacterium]|nr:hypothetical protein [Alphaproteobacteria bacterium]